MHSFNFQEFLLQIHVQWETIKHKRLHIPLCMITRKTFKEIKYIAVVYYPNSYLTKALVSTKQGILLSTAYLSLHDKMNNFKVKKKGIKDISS